MLNTDVDAGHPLMQALVQRLYFKLSRAPIKWRVAPKGWGNCIVFFNVGEALGIRDWDLKIGISDQDNSVERPGYRRTGSFDPRLNMIRAYPHFNEQTPEQIVEHVRAGDRLSFSGAMNAINFKHEMTHYLQKMHQQPDFMRNDTLWPTLVRWFKGGFKGGRKSDYQYLNGAHEVEAFGASLLDDFYRAVLQSGDRVTKSEFVEEYFIIFYREQPNYQTEGTDASKEALRRMASQFYDAHAKRIGRGDIEKAAGVHSIMQLSRPELEQNLADPETRGRLMRIFAGAWSSEIKGDPYQLAKKLLPYTIAGGDLSAYHPGPATIYRGYSHDKEVGPRSWSKDKRYAKMHGPKLKSIKITEATPALDLDKILTSSSGASMREIITTAG